MTTCRACYWWKRRDDARGTCWQRLDSKNPPAEETGEDDTCELFHARVIRVPPKPATERTLLD